MQKKKLLKNIDVLFNSISLLFKSIGLLFNSISLLFKTKHRFTFQKHRFTFQKHRFTFQKHRFTFQKDRLTSKSSALISLKWTSNENKAYKRRFDKFNIIELIIGSRILKTKHAAVENAVISTYCWIVYLLKYCKIYLKW